MDGVGDLARPGGQVDGQGEERPEDERVAVEEVTGARRRPSGPTLRHGCDGWSAAGQGSASRRGSPGRSRCMGARRSMAVRWMKEKASASAMPWLSIRTPLARSTTRWRLELVLEVATSPDSRACSSSMARYSCEAGQGHLDGRDQLAALEGLHQVGRHAGVAGVLDEVALAEGGEDEDGHLVLGRDPPGRLDPVQSRHLDVEDGQVGLGAASPARRPRRRGRSPPPPRSPRPRGSPSDRGG